MESIRPSKRPPFFRWARSRPLTRLAVPLLLLTSLPVYAQSTGSDPWDNAVNVLKTAFTGPIATGLSLVAIVVGGLMFAFGEGQSKKTIAFRDHRLRRGHAQSARSTSWLGSFRAREDAAKVIHVLQASE